MASDQGLPKTHGVPKRSLEDSRMTLSSKDRPTSVGITASRMYVDASMLPRLKFGQGNRSIFSE